MTGLEKSCALPFPRAVVYAAWVSSDMVIAPATAMDIEPVVGGHYRLFVDSPQYTGRNEGRFLAVEPGHRLRYTWEWNGDGEVTEIDVRFTDSAQGTRIDLVHSGFRSPDGASAHDSGWDGYIAGLAEFLTDRR